VAEGSEHRRGVSALCAETVTVGVAFFWLLFLAKQEKWLGEAEIKWQKKKPSVSFVKRTFAAQT